MDTTIVFTVLRSTSTGVLVRGTEVACLPTIAQYVLTNQDMSKDCGDLIKSDLKYQREVAELRASEDMYLYHCLNCGWKRSRPGL